MPIDVAQFRETFFEESFEGLEIIESGLLALEPGAVDLDLINTIFRAAHSIKGGSGSFGLTQITDFTHQIETLLDQMRSEERPVTEDVVDLLLRARDHLAATLTALRAGETIDSAAGEAIEQELALILGLPEKGDEGDGDESEEQRVGWTISFTPHAEMLQSGNDPVRIIRELRELGEVYPELQIEGLPFLHEIDTTECYIGWYIVVVTERPREDLEEVFEWVSDECELDLRPIHMFQPKALLFPDIACELGLMTREQCEFVAQKQSESEFERSFEIACAAERLLSLTQVEKIKEEQYRRIADARAAARVAATRGDDVLRKGMGDLFDASAGQMVAGVSSAPATVVASGTSKSAGRASVGSAGTANSLRVSTEKIDALVNMVGELVITQSMLKQVGTDFEMEKLEALRSGLVQLERNSRELQEAVMRIRMLPISSVFQRFPRLVRDTSQALGKKVDLIVSGEQTELDKTVLEKLGDPLVHIVRNSLDHGIEPPEDRIRAGKPETGHIRLHAAHEGGKIQIEISDDGRGLSREKILKKARTQGLIGPDSSPSVEETFDLVFHPGFSTAEKITDVSGRGVGMDVVKRNIKALGGTVQLSSEEGEGTKLTIRLPLTVAILDGQLLRVGSETYILPLVSIIESITIEPASVLVIAGRAEVYRLRSEQLPIIRMYEIFGLKPEITDLRDGLLVVVEAEGRKAGIFVDELLEQQQVVIKSLESNYRPVQGLSGATILGDGRVAMILDVGGLMSLALDAASKSGRVKARDRSARGRSPDQMEDATA